VNDVDWSLYLVTDRDLAGGRSIADIVLAAVAGGATVVQVREKSLATRAFLELASALAVLLRPLRVPLVVNDRADVALAAGAAGVHLGQDDLPCAAARRLLGPAAIVGVSVSTAAEARAAEGDGATYVAASPVFDTPTKLDAAPGLGLAGVRAVRAATRLPVVAIGGLGEANAGDVVRAGADGVAVVSAIVAAPEPRAAARALRRAVDAARRAP
jgi:thiamine-phosphate pyrophosphorylase